MSKGGEIICERIEEVRKLVIAATKCWFGKKGYESDDIIQEGLLGVMINRDAYDPERGSLGTFVTVTARRYVIGHRFQADATSKRRVNFEALYLDQPRMLSEISKELCVSSERVRQLESAGLRRLRRGMGA